MMQSHLGKSIAQLAVLLQSGSLDPVVLVEETLDAIRTQSDQAIFTALLDARAKEGGCIVATIAGRAVARIAGRHSGRLERSFRG